MINVLSYFDGISGGQIALERANIPIANYFAAEIDKLAITVTQANYPNTIQLGDVTKVKAKDLPKIDLLIGGSPCQGFSFAGKQLNFEDPRSKLFFEFVRILKEIREINPKVKFILENVNMKTQYLRIISEFLGVFPININSNLVSAQNRNRFYWTNIRTKKVGLFGEIHSDIPLPKDKGIFLEDILQPENEIDEKFYIKNPKIFKALNIKLKSKTLRASGFVTQSKKYNFDIIDISNINSIQFDVSGKGYNSQQDRIYFNHSKMQALSANRAETKINYLKVSKYGTIKNKQKKASTITGGGNSGGDHSDMDLLLFQKPRGKNTGGIFRQKNTYINSCSWQENNHIYSNYKLRRLTPIECERLQTVPDNFTNYVSQSQRYKMLGNGWTIDVIAHILKYYEL